MSSGPGESNRPDAALRLSGVLDNLSDPFALLDASWRFSYLNPAACEVLGGEDLIGEKVWERFPAAVGSELNLKLLQARETGRAAEMMLRPREFGLNTDAWYNLRAYPVPEGIAVIAWDATAARRIEEEREELLQSCKEVSEVLQRALLPPSLPRIPGAELGAAYVAVGEAVEVGGDFYDVFAIEDDGWALVVGDVTGKGPEAASLTSFVRYTVRAAAMRIKHPRDVLEALNREVLRQTAGERLFTAVYAELELVGRGEAVVRLACAGHPSPLVARTTGEVEWLPETGMILGETERPGFSTHEFVLGAGDSMVFYTDGVTEARNAAGEFFGEERLLTLVGRLAGASAGEIASAIEERALGFQDGRARDDIAVLVLKLQG